MSCCQPSSPDGVCTNVSYAPSRNAVWFINATVCRTPPAARASAAAVSLPDMSSSPVNNWSTVYRPPATMPTAEPSAFAESGPTVTTRLPGSSGRSVTDVSVLRMLAGW